MAELNRENLIARGYLAAIMDTCGKKRTYTITTTSRLIIEKARRCAKTLGAKPVKEYLDTCFRLSFNRSDRQRLGVQLRPHFAQKSDLSDRQLEDVADALRRIRFVLEEQAEQRELTVLESSIYEQAKRGKNIDEELGWDT